MEGVRTPMLMVFAAIDHQSISLCKRNPKSLGSPDVTGPPPPLLANVSGHKVRNVPNVLGAFTDIISSMPPTHPAMQMLLFPFYIQ